MKNVLLVSGFNGIPKIFYYFKKELEKEGYNVIMPEFPVRDNITIDRYFKIFNNYKQYFTKDLIVIAHSIGNPIIIKYISKNKLEVDQYISLAGFSKSFFNNGKDILNEKLKTTILTKNEIDDVKNLISNRASIYSNSDHLVPIELLENFCCEINSIPINIENIGHMGKRSGIEQLPIVIDIIKRKKTLLFSNIRGNVSTKNNKVDFNNYMKDYLKNNLDNSYSLVFIGAPGLGGEENYFPNIIKCFKKIDIEFKNIIDIEEMTTHKEIKEFFVENNKYIFFLMGGNPITQKEIIDKFKLNEKIKNHNDLVIGFCAGAINLSKYAIITSDEDFNNPISYKGIEREEICIEPHYNTGQDGKRNDELYDFCNKYKTKIYAIPDESMIVIEDSNIYEFGKIYYFE